jgi:cyclophilin family peptidyl-prolyl cis-trans isomerase
MLYLSLLKKSLGIANKLAVTAMLLSAVACAKTKTEPVVILDTDKGQITLQLHPDYAPKTVELFLKHVDEGFYKDVIFHRVIPNFMAQTGGYSEGFLRRVPLGTVVNESYGGLPNITGSVAMARTSDPDSASSQFFINVVDNPALNAQGESAGYTVFATVTQGLEVAKAITEAPRGEQVKYGHQDAPNETIRIKTASRGEPAKAMVFPEAEVPTPLEAEPTEPAASDAAH